MLLIKLILKIPRILLFILFYLKELLLSNISVAWQVLTPNATMKPAIVGVPLDITNEYAINLLANLITMTPGTLSMDVSEDKKTLYIHVLHVTDLEAFKKQIKTSFESKIEKLFA